LKAAIVVKMASVARQPKAAKPDVKAPDIKTTVQPLKDSKDASGSAYAHIACGLALLAICVMAFSLRLFSVVKYESVIHEFDPYFNFRVTVYLTKEGFYNLWNWFDDRTWYPLGRVVGGTVYPVREFTVESCDGRSDYQKKGSLTRSSFHAGFDLDRGLNV
jgi:hypothetical protein